ncbi:YopX family protein [Paenibacillus sp. PDC88]|uniref:YopX family protein n=1 Tax=Paenibacillus sp. PDC88 TaxID=1884375 RepID=UPI00089C8FDF|nr:YopX family protein [Paenibacillus sp. PDC88]SDX04602.1 phage uncharacterized protein TIGR01671 [Paenibacillus sp. PDC88]
MQANMLKFRAWDKDRGRWLNEDEIVQRLIFNQLVGGAGKFQIDERTSNDLAKDIGYSIDIMQCTGLKDIDGREIFEGDIVTLTVPDQEYVEVGNGWMDAGVNKGFYKKGVVRFLYSMWMLDEGDGKGGPLEWEDKQTLELHGNIYENKELIEND